MANPSVTAIAAVAERMIADMSDHATARRLHAEVNRLRAGAEALDSVNSNRSPLDTPAAHALKAAEKARKFDREVTATLNRSAAIYGEALDDLRRRIDDKLNLKPVSDQEAREIREVFRGMGSKERAGLMKDLVDEGRGPELAALLNASSPILTGLSEPQRQMYREAFIAKHAAAELSEQERLGRVFEGVTAATRAAGEFVKLLTDPGTLADIERGAAAAAAAGDAFDQSLAQE
jgi:hypothetical protein